MCSFRCLPSQSSSPLSSPSMISCLLTSAFSIPIFHLSLFLTSFSLAFNAARFRFYLFNSNVNISIFPFPSSFSHIFLFGLYFILFIKGRRSCGFYFFITLISLRWLSRFHYSSSSFLCCFYILPPTPPLLHVFL